MRHLHGSQHEQMHAETLAGAKAFCMQVQTETIYTRSTLILCALAAASELFHSDGPDLICQQRHRPCKSEYEQPNKHPHFNAHDNGLNPSADVHSLMMACSVQIRGVAVGSVAEVQSSLERVVVTADIKEPTTVIPRNSLIEANQSGLIAEPLIDITPQLPIPKYTVSRSSIKMTAGLGPTRGLFV